MKFLKRSVSLFAGLRWKTSGSRSPARSVFMKRTAEHTIFVARTNWSLYSLFGSGLKVMKGLKFSTTGSRAERYISNHGPERKRLFSLKVLKFLYDVHGKVGANH